MLKDIVGTEFIWIWRGQVFIKFQRADTLTKNNLKTRFQVLQKADTLPFRKENSIPFNTQSQLTCWALGEGWVFWLIPTAGGWVDLILVRTPLALGPKAQVSGHRSQECGHQVVWCPESQLASPHARPEEVRIEKIRWRWWPLTRSQAQRSWWASPFSWNTRLRLTLNYETEMRSTVKGVRMWSINKLNHYTDTQQTVFIRIRATGCIKFSVTLVRRLLKSN